MWLFSRKYRDIRTLPAVSDECHSWRVARAGYDDSPLIIRHNETAKDWIGHPGLPIKLGFAVPLNSPDEGGLPDPMENQQLNDIEDGIVRAVESETQGIHVLTLTTGTMKEFVFYVPRDTDIKTIHETIQQSVCTHEIQCMAVLDPNWDSYTQVSL
jgi:hypothetical protein